MSDGRHQMGFSHAELVSLYLALSRQEKDLDELQIKLLARVSETLYSQLSVSEMEEIESYYQALHA